MISLTKKNVTVISLTIALLLLPVIGYFASINKIHLLAGLANYLNLSPKNEDWGDFGSFISGMYGSVFSFLSLIAVLVSLYLTQKNNREQISILKTEQFTNEFLVLLETLKKTLSEKKYAVLNPHKDLESFTNDIYFLVGIFMQEDPSINSANIDKHALSYTFKALQRRDKSVFEKESPLMREIILRINMANKTLSMTYLAILKSQISNDAVFLLCAFMCNHDTNDISFPHNLFITPEGLKEAAKKQFILRR